MEIILKKHVRVHGQRATMPKGKESRPKHIPWNSELPFESQLSDKEKHIFLLEAYKKHAAELSSLEDRLNKIVLLILGLFGAGVTAASTINLKGQWQIALCFVVIVGGVGWLGHHAVGEAADLRKAVRDLLVRCELAMDFYTPDKFVRGKALYGEAERDYPQKGGSLTLPSDGVILVAAVLLIVLIGYNWRRGLPEKNSGASISVVVSH
jgi:hypothetical protein